MRITDVKTVCSEIPWQEPIRPGPSPGTTWKFVGVTLVQVLTDEEITGSFPYTTMAAPLHRPLKLIVDEWIRPYLIGKDPFEVEKLWRTMNYQWAFRGFTPWAVEIALWDIIGKASRQPIYRLLGGAQEKVRAYLSTIELKEPKDRAKDAVKWREQGFRAIKLRAHYPDPRKDLEVVKAVRDAVGEDMDIMVDANQAVATAPPFWSRRTALMMARELEKLGVYWLEEPLPMNDLDGLAKLCKEVGISISGGELEWEMSKWRLFVEKGCFDILQPDVTLSGGILQVRKIAAIADTWNKLCAPHTCCVGTTLAANLQVMGAIPNCPYAEFMYEPPGLTVEARDAILKEPIRIDRDGCVEIPKKPGLGVEIDEELIKKHQVK